MLCAEVILLKGKALMLGAVVILLKWKARDVRCCGNFTKREGT
jgi:hypothetical protein